MQHVIEYPYRTVCHQPITLEALVLVLFGSPRHILAHRSISSHLFTDMSNPNPSQLPPLRRVVTTHDAQGLAVVESTVVLEPEVSLTNQFPGISFIPYLSVWKPFKEPNQRLFGLQLMDFQSTTIIFRAFLSRAP
jgi:hypothetical protein